MSSKKDEQSISNYQECLHFGKLESKPQLNKIQVSKGKPIKVENLQINTDNHELAQQASDKSLLSSYKQQRISRKGVNSSSQKEDETNLLQQISAKQFIVSDRITGQTILQKNSGVMRECASLTKMMTVHLALMLCERLGLEVGLTWLQVSKKSARMIGTSAQLLKGGWLTLRDLLYGMMLPSGNDAALTVAENLGLANKLGLKELQKRLLSYEDTFGSYDANYCRCRFLKHGNQLNSLGFISLMNQECHQMKMYNTRFNNVHGLCDRLNKSSCQDMSILSRVVVQHELVRKMAGTQTYTCRSLDEQGKEKALIWTNTNKLLGTAGGWDGLKTGITYVAGPCLASTTPLTIVILFNSKTMAARWTEAQLLAHYATKYHHHL